MIRIVTVENPFEPFIHDVEEAVCLGVTLDRYFADLEGRDVFLNGKYVEVPAEVTPVDGDQIILAPHVEGGGLKKILGFVAMIALSALTGGIIAGGASLFGMSIASAGSIGAYLYAGAVMYLGGRLINALFPQQINARAHADREQSQTYGWDLPTLATTEGGVIGETYGTCIPQAQLLTEHVETTADGKPWGFGLGAVFFMRKRWAIALYLTVRIRITECCPTKGWKHPGRWNHQQRWRVLQPLRLCFVEVKCAW